MIILARASLFVDACGRQAKDSESGGGFLILILHLMQRRRMKNPPPAGEGEVTSRQHGREGGLLVVYWVYWLGRGRRADRRSRSGGRHGEHRG